MAKLVLYLPDGSLHDILLDKERLTIGRRADNDVCLPYPAVSGEHAAVVTILADSFLEDLGSTNGTLVNGKAVVKHFLRDNDLIDIGRQRLVYFSQDDVRAEPLTPDMLRHEVRGLHEQVQRVRETREEKRKPAAVPPGGAAAPPALVDEDLFADIESATEESDSGEAAPAGSDDRPGESDGPAVVARHPGESGGPAVSGRHPGEGRDPASSRHPGEGRDPASSRHPGEGRDPASSRHPGESRDPASSAHPGESRDPASLGPTHHASTVASRLASTWSQGPEPAPADEAAPPDQASSAAASIPPETLDPAYRIRVLSGPSEGREVVLNRPQVSVGRVGTQVACVRAAKGRWLLSALEGAEPVQLNGSPIPAEGAALRPGDRFRVAETDLVFEPR